MPQLTMEEKIPTGRIASVPERSLRSRRLNSLQKSNTDVKDAVVSEVCFLWSYKILYNL